MPADLYESSVPVFLRFLERLSGLVSLAESHAAARGLTTESVLRARLAADMLPFEAQVHIATHFALRACMPVVGQPVPPYGDYPSTPDGLRARIARSIALIEALKPEDFESAEAGVVEDIAGQATVRLPAAKFLSEYALPNFFFHLSMAYAILRNQGVTLSKAHFDGFHVYP